MPPTEETPLKAVDFEKNVGFVTEGMDLEKNVGLVTEGTASAFIGAAETYEDASGSAEEAARGVLHRGVSMMGRLHGGLSHSRSVRNLLTPIGAEEADRRRQKFFTEYLIGQLVTVGTFFLMALMYLLLGMLVYNQLEGWKPLYAFYFSIVTITTVGYGGHGLEPTDDGTRVFSIFYTYVGLFMVASRVLNLVTVTLNRRTHYYAQLAEFEATTKVSSVESKGDEDAPLHLAEPPSALRYYLVNLALINGMLFGATFLGAGIFCACESDAGLRYVDAFYFAWITVTTIGYGDWALTNDTSIGFNCAFILLTAVMFTFLAGKMSELAAERAEEVRRWTIYSQRQRPTEMDQGLLQKLTHTAVKGKHSRYSFLVEMLVHHELVQRIEVELIDEYFDLLDKNGDEDIDIEEMLSEAKRVSSFR